MNQLALIVMNDMPVEVNQSLSHARLTTADPSPSLSIQLSASTWKQATIHACSGRQTCKKTCSLLMGVLSSEALFLL